LPQDVAAFLPWQQQLVALAQQVLRGKDATPVQLVSLCLWPEVLQVTTYRVGPAGAPPLLDSGCELLHNQRVAYTRCVWAARLLLAGVWLALVAGKGSTVGRFSLDPASGAGVHRVGGFCPNLTIGPALHA
jgi:hypothetical protein